MRVTLEQARQLSHDLGDILVVRHVNRLEHMRPQDSIGGIRDTRGGRIAMANDHAQIITRSTRRTQGIPHLDKQNQLRQIIEFHAEGDLGLGCHLLDDRCRTWLIFGQ